MSDIRHELSGTDRVQLTWSTPATPNGLIHFYFVSYKQLLDDNGKATTLPATTIDHCLAATKGPASAPTLSRPIAHASSPLQATHHHHQQQQQLISPTANTTCPQVSSRHHRRRLLNPNDDQDGQDDAEDDTNEELIRVEDDIYNLAFQRAPPSRANTNRSHQTTRFTTLSQPTDTSTTTVAHSPPNATTARAKSVATRSDASHASVSVDELLDRLVRRHLLIGDGDDDDSQPFVGIRTTRLDVTLSELRSYTRYIVSVSCSLRRIGSIVSAILFSFTYSIISPDNGMSRASGQ